MYAVQGTILDFAYTVTMLLSTPLNNSFNRLKGLLHDTWKAHTMATALIWTIENLVLEIFLFLTGA